MFTISTIYFLIYLSIFIFIGLTSSIFIVPLLITSFVFATLVVIFGFISNSTLNLALWLFFKTNMYMRKTINKRRIFKNQKQNSDPDADPNATPIEQDENVLELNPIISTTQENN
ncbi:hypothetical protein TBLA_0B09160 [Henningerozyma blattae CBS 6284]|uniref:Outer spore wall protein 5 n=1 Tax=Henningerozyma blattae (strain ATCC 34711 / CBS 6284 / DSM 70876 / NBRC 10599 / NRRL Y-10934 / UCD 77-7) TaxID=1071380 RepID=I2H029_HENB6|nr:hypothetical protein TBLA_0B09160 [Tetrapisispora blattae CBS 6284]CCH59731.1 hypothetical protein TBLA_0B09160 [Tetrapisispora blattae CBS 6284]